jgi:D-alanyl-lipoteichoic acid acyltransferase DltB (MBOAT superfamily)
MRELWQRWHMTLSTFFRDYVYIPMGGSRSGKWFAARNALLVMALSGLWHGAAWNFVIWGLLNGVFLVVEILLDRRRDPAAAASPWRDSLRVFWTFSLFCAALAFFRAATVEEGWILLQRIALWAGDVDGVVRIRERGLWVLLLAFLLHYFPLRWYRASQRWLMDRSPITQGALAACSLGFFGVTMTAGQPFIYFQF